MFTPWTSLDDYIKVFEFLETYNLINHVDPVQYAIRLLIPPGSILLERPAVKPHLGSLDHASFSYEWTHPDSRMDELHKTVSALVERDSQAGEDEIEIFYAGVGDCCKFTRGVNSRSEYASNPSVSKCRE